MKAHEKGKAEPGKMMRTLMKWTGRLVLLGALLAILAVFSVLAPGWQSNTVLSGSMHPAIALDEPELPANQTADQIADEPARYNFASAWGASSLQVIPGGEVKGVIRFYNVDGNRTTYITLEVVQAPSNWEVEIDPPLHNVEVESGGHTITVAENLHAEPTQLSPEPIEDVPEGMVCLTVPDRGYALAKVATIIIRVPEAEEPGPEGDIKITAVASWLGQTGAASIRQTRDFDFSVRTGTTKD